MFFSAMYSDILLLGVPPLWVYNRNTVDEDGDFQPLYTIVSRTR